MGKLVDFYTQHRRLFLKQKHDNTSQTERFRHGVIIKFLTYCEEAKYQQHTNAIKSKKVVIKFFQSQQIQALSSETRRKYFYIIAEFYKRFYKIILDKDEVLKNNGGQGQGFKY